MLLRLAYKNILSRRSSVVIIAFIAFAIMLLVVTNAVFDSTEQGVERTFIESFTGDVLIRPLSDVPLSLFGDETPVTGELTEIERLVPYSDVFRFLAAQPAVMALNPQISCRAIVENGENRLPLCLFGVDAAAYVAAMPAITVLDGTPYAEGEKGIMLTQTLAEQLGVAVGDTLQCTITDGLSFRIRAVTVSAVYAYVIPNKTLDTIALVDAVTVRELLDVGSAAESAELLLDAAQEQLLAADFSDDIFFADADVETAFWGDEEDRVSSVRETPADEPDEMRSEVVQEKSTTWNFIICSLRDEKHTASIIRAFNDAFRKNGWPVEAVNWRSAAGSTALYLYWLRLIFTIGILVILAAGFIVVNNTLVITVLDRLREIGTMRAIGTSKTYISLECMAETLLLTVIAGFAGCVLGFFASKLVTALHIVFTNDFLMQLFGNDALVTHVTAGNVGNAFLLSALLGLIAWIYPVHTAMQVQPVQAMQGAK